MDAIEDFQTPLTTSQLSALPAVRAMIDERLGVAEYFRHAPAEQQLSAQGQGDSVAAISFDGFVQTLPPVEYARVQDKGMPITIQQAELSADAIAHMARELTKDMASTQPGFMDQFAPAIETI